MDLLHPLKACVLKAWFPVWEQKHGTSLKMLGPVGHLLATGRLVLMETLGPQSTSCHFPAIV